MTDFTWWRHQMETFSALLALCARNSPVNGESPTQRPVTRSFDAFFDLRLNKRLSKQSWGWWSDTPSCSLWHQCNVEWGHANGYFKADGMGAARAVSWYCAFSTNKDTHYLLYDNDTSQQDGTNIAAIYRTDLVTDIINCVTNRNGGTEATV